MQTVGDSFFISHAETSLCLCTSNKGKAKKQGYRTADRCVDSLCLRSSCGFFWGNCSYWFAGNYHITHCFRYATGKVNFKLCADILIVHSLIPDDITMAEDVGILADGDIVAFVLSPQAECNYNSMER